MSIQNLVIEQKTLSVLVGNVSPFSWLCRGLSARAFARNSLLCVWLMGHLMPALTLGQSMPAEILKQPDALVNPAVQDSELFQVPWKDLEKRVSRAWIVFSDRAENVVLNAAGGNPTGERLGFLERFYVVGEDGEYLQLLRMNGTPDGLKVPSGSSPVGWIKRDKLLTWSHCLLTPDGALSLRGVVQNTVKYAKNRRDGKPDLVVLRSQPSTQGHGVEEVRLNRFFYLYKVDLGQPSIVGDEYALLGRQHMFTPGEEARVIMGWAPLSRVVVWNHRVALEPNWEPAAWAERKDRQKAVVLKDVPSARAYAQGNVELSGGPLWDADPGDTRRPGEWKRFPVLSDDPATPGLLLKVGVMGTIYSTSDTSSPVAPESKVASLEDKIDTWGTLHQNVNIVFVVDGTRSFGEYYGPIVTSIRETMTQLTQEQSRSKYRFGAVVYRDGQEPREKWLASERIGSADAVVKFLPDKEYHKLDQTDAEAVNYGLKSALGLFNAVPNAESQSNVIVLIGDAGNHSRTSDATYVPAQALWDDFIRFRVNFLAIQVHRYPDDAYTRFVTDQIELGGRVAIQAWERLRTTYEGNGLQFERPKWELDGAIHRLSGGSLRMEVHAQPEQTAMKPEELGRRVGSLLHAIDKQNEALQKELIHIKDGGAGNTVCGPSTTKDASPADAVPALGCAVLEILRAAEISPEDLKILQQDKFQLYTEGVVAMKVQGQTHELFRRSLLLSRTELDELRDTMGRFIQASSGNMRSRTRDMWLTLLKRYLGSVSDEELLNLTLTECNQKVFGVSGTSELLTKVKLMEIDSPEKFSEQEMNKYHQRVTRLWQRIREVSLHPERESSCFDTQEEAQCWIDEMMIP